MKVNLVVSNELEEEYADIHTRKITENLQRAIILLENSMENNMMAVKKGSNIQFLELAEIYMFKVHDNEVHAFNDDEEYIVKKSLYKIEEELNSDFVRISRSAIVNIRKIERVAPSLKGTMFIEMKNGLKDNISRKYLPIFKEALNL